MKNTILALALFVLPQMPLFCGGGDDDDGSPEPRTCEEIQQEFVRETESIRSCEAAAQCGQVLKGTSCGCTRDWVARLDADTTTFYALMDEANAQGCDLGLVSPCDCPEADGFACESGMCNWNYLD